MTIREFCNNDFTIDGDVVIKLFKEQSGTYEILGYRYYELEEKEKDYIITYIYCKDNELVIETNGEQEV